VPGARPLAADELVEAALAEDVGDGDRTTAWTVPDGAVGSARIVARADGLLAGRGPAARVFELLDPRARLDWSLDDGDRVTTDSTVARIEGSLAAILTGERTALNFLGRLSGIATLTARYVEAVDGTGSRVIDTRKTTPAWRSLEKAAVAAGGAQNHRHGLYDMVLIKENHIRAAGGVAAAIRGARDRARAEGIELEVEVTSLTELDEALAEGADRVLLDNMDNATLAACVARTREAEPPRPLLEASGGISLETVRSVAATGVDLISVGAITHSAPAFDLSLLVDL